MVRISEEEAKRLGLALPQKDKAKRKKYNNQACEFRGLKFDSIKEHDYYIILLDKLKHNEISELKRQVKLIIQPSFKMPNGETVKEIYYLADFSYKDSAGIIHYIDVKGGEATKTAVYKLKKKLLASKGFDVEVV